MSKSTRWPVFLALALVFSILVGSIGFASQPAYAQGSFDLTQLFASTDGALSLRLPATWVAIDDTGNPDLALFSTIIFFGAATEVGVGCGLDVFGSQTRAGKG